MCPESFENNHFGFVGRFKYVCEAAFGLVSSASPLTAREVLTCPPGISVADDMDVRDI
jgi:hypothetical protein